MTPPASRLDDPDYAAFAWDRYRRLLRWMLLAALVGALLSVAILRLLLTEVPLVMAIATAVGTFLTIGMAAALMGLVFLSSGSGHDESIIDPFAEENR